MVMNHPSAFIGSYHGNVAIDAAILLISEMTGNLRMLLVELDVGFLESLSLPLDEPILFGIDKPCLKEEFPQVIHVHIVGNRGMGVERVAEKMSQSAIGTDAHVENGDPAPDPLFPFGLTIDDLGEAIDFWSACKTDRKIRKELPRDDQPLLGVLVNRQTRGGNVLDIQLHLLPKKRVIKNNTRRWK